MFAPIVSHMLLKTPVEPVKCTPASAGSARTWREIAPASPGTKLITPGGSPASSRMRNTYHAESIAVDAGFQSTVLPIIAGAPARLPPMAVKLNGETA